MLAHPALAVFEEEVAEAHDIIAIADELTQARLDYGSIPPR
jgi:hypothetical protein